MTSVVSEEIRAAIENLAKAEIEGVKLHRVDAEQDFDSDGESIVKIAVVVDHPEKIQSSSFTAFARAVRNKFAHEGNLFPLISFRSVADDKGMSSEAA